MSRHDNLLDGSSRDLSATEYEKLVRDVLCEQLRETFGREVAVYHDRSYRGKSGQEHQIDVSADLAVAGVRVLLVAECKMYSRKVSTREVLQLAARLEDIAAHKGILFAPRGFQEGAKKLAEASGIALVTLDDRTERIMTISPHPDDLLLSYAGPIDALKAQCAAHAKGPVGSTLPQEPPKFSPEQGARRTVQKAGDSLRLRLVRQLMEAFSRLFST